jgi:hypothetical protein
MSQFLAAYEQYAASVTDAPPDFLHAAGLAALSTISLGRRWIERGSSGIQANVFFMLLAGSSRDRKSTAVNQSVDLLREVEPGRVGPEDFSGEGLIWALCPQDGAAGKTKMIIPAPEFGNYLATASKNHGNNMSPTLCRLYDGDTFERVRSGKKVAKIKKPRVSMLGGVAFGMLEKYGDPTDWVTGFFARVLWISPTRRRPRFAAPPEPNRHEYMLVRDKLRDLRLVLKAQRMPLALSREALQIYEAFDHELPADLPDPAQGAQRERLMISTLKLSLLYQVDLNHNAAISAQAMDAAVQFSRRSWESFQIAYADSTGSTLGKTAKRIWRYLTSECAEQGHVCPKRDLYRAVHCNVEDFMPAIELLCKLGVIAATRLGNLQAYKCLDLYRAY